MVCPRGSSTQEDLLCAHKRLLVHTELLVCTAEKLSCVHTREYLSGAHSRRLMRAQGISCVHTMRVLCARRTSLVCTKEISYVRAGGPLWVMRFTKPQTDINLGKPTVKLNSKVHKLTPSASDSDKRHRSLEAS